MNDKTAYRGALFYFKDTATMNNVPVNKKNSKEEECHYVYIEDGLLIIESGKIVAVGDYEQLKASLAEIKLIDYQGKLITPGFIDTHQHATQSAIVAAYGEKLLHWLEDYVFPGESVYVDDETATKDLNFFLDQLVRNGTTTAVSYGPLFYSASDIFFEELKRRNMRFITGNVLMDINSPDNLKLSVEQNYDNCKQLIEKWHNTRRLSYCISPRFALACSEQMLELCGTLKKENPDCYIQTHLDENINEVAEVKKLYPWSKHYMDVYDRFGLVTDRSVFGHCIHTTDEELKLFKKSGAIMSWCPLSNNFLGSGLFDFGRTRKYTDKITLGTDWGAGNCLSMFAVLDDAYKVSMLNSVKLPSMTRWYMATYGAAKALQLDDKIGTFKPGMEADFIVIDADATPYLKYRREKVNDIFELLFILMTLGSEENIKATYIYGEAAYINGI
ncbi:guanine deaminase [Legionella shakespearei]|uniref:Guanine deaminase n=1 Tax=Legionella shakespearei DSM 23087 TaxID=1122169 RepID=A0A0W0YQS9_9GAMM|nr:guanine deaminase [Legionella shakespearei]KTD59243.1 guanine aminohydrolase [Legionella shakespearei DSM 23087]